MIRSSIRAEVSGRCYDDTNAIASVAVVNLWLDLAVRTLWKAYAWPFKSKVDNTLVCTPTVGTVVMPVDLQEIKKLTNLTLSQVLVPRNERWLENFSINTANPGPPIFYVDGGLSQAANNTGPSQRQLRLYPAPDSAYSLHLRYLKLPALYSTQSVPDSAYSPFPEDFDEAIIQWCLQRYAYKLTDMNLLSTSRAAYAEELKSLIATYSTLTETFPMIDMDEATGGLFGTRAYL